MARQVDCAADARYGFLLDDDPAVPPIPGPRQPGRGNERSQLWIPPTRAGPISEWRGRSIEGR